MSEGDGLIVVGIFVALIAVGMSMTGIGRSAGRVGASLRGRSTKPAGSCGQYALIAVIIVGALLLILGGRGM